MERFASKTIENLKLKGLLPNYLKSIATFFNEYWVYPAESEKPKNASTVEMGCYWK